ncbi:YbaN family protein [Citreicella sp. C3M06]|uniref:YbaN family protein n=1 Tax=Citreicella sp. C3M06 TaxID=2841564 RepID=UPI002090039E|nr:YbaN family protein [Citreicella sp. C3M06]
MRIFWIICGSLALALGVLGIALPLLPTTPLVLLAAFCYARGSERMHRWLLRNRVFGPMIRDWHAEGAISARARTLAVGTMGGVFAIGLALGLPWQALLFQGVAMGGAAIFILTRPLPKQGS